MFPTKADARAHAEMIGARCYTISQARRRPVDTKVMSRARRWLTGDDEWPTMAERIAFVHGLEAAGVHPRTVNFVETLFNDSHAE